jgi:hypothetical protein
MLTEETRSRAELKGRIYYVRLCLSVNATLQCSKIDVQLYNLLFVLVVGPISTAAMKAYRTLTPLEFRHSSLEALHTKRRERPLLAKDGTKAKEFS